jgi:NADH-quinone oxidoreductase subunit G
MRSVIGTGNVDARMGDGLDVSLLTGPRGAIGDLESAATVLVWGPDLKEEVPVLYLRVRRAATELGAKLVVVHPRRTGLDDVAEHTIRYRPGEGAALLDRLARGDGDLAGVAAALRDGPVVAIVGRTGLSDDPALPVAVTEFAAALPEASVLPATRAPNVFGAADMGLVPDGEGRDADGIVAGLEDGSVKALVLFAADPLAGYPDPVRAAAAIAEAEFVLAFDLFRTASNADADVVLPALGFTEIEGTVTNLEGRVQKVNRLVSGPGRARASWEALEDLARRLGGTVGGTDAGALAAAIEAEVPGYSGITWDSLDRGDGRDGIVAATPERAPAGGAPAADAPGDGMVLHLGRVLYEHDRTVAHGPSLAKLVPEPAVYLHPQDARRHGIDAGDRVMLRGSHGSAELDTVFDASLAPGTVYLPFNVGASVGSGPSVHVEAVS